MALRDRRNEVHQNNPHYVRCRRKADEQWELAGCARQDGDAKAALEHTNKAREFEQMARDAVQ